jgi:protein TonB
MRSIPAHVFATWAMAVVLLGATFCALPSVAAPLPPLYLWGTAPSLESDDLAGSLARVPSEPAEVPTFFLEEAPGRPVGYREELPVSVTRVIPEYPPLALEAEIGGLVMAQALVGRDGRVLDARVDKEHSVTMLDDAALEAVRHWVFMPARANGEPVEVWVAVPFNFHLR